MSGRYTFGVRELGIHAAILLPHFCAQIVVVVVGVRGAMKLLFGLPELFVVGLLAVLLCSIVVKKLFKVSFAAALSGSAVPLLMPLGEMPILQHFNHYPRFYLVGGVWAAMVSCGVLWVFLRPFFSAAVTSFGLLRLGYFALLAMALFVSVFLVCNQDILINYFPGWKSSLGMLLLATTLICIARAMVKVIQESTVVLLWGAVSLVLASSIFLNKLPHHISKEDVMRVEDGVPGELATKTLEYLNRFFQGGVGAFSFLKVSQDKDFVAQSSDDVRSVDT